MSATEPRGRRIRALAARKLRWLLAGVLLAAAVAGPATAPSSARDSRRPANHPVRHHKRHRRHHKRHRHKHPAKPQPPAAPSLKPGAPDPSFGVGGTATVSVGSWAAAAAAVVQPDGKIVTAGETGLGGRYGFVSTRMDTDGRLDPSYGKGGVATPSVSGDSGANALVLQPDGKIILAGSATVGNVLSFAAVRLLPNGLADPTFGHGGLVTVPIGSSSIVTAVALQPDGRIVLGGTAMDGHVAFAAARLNPNGSLDRSFGSGGVEVLGPVAAAWGMTLQPDGSIVLAGETGGLLGLQSLAAIISPETALLPGNLTSSLLNLGTQYMAARLLPSGRPDPSFGNGGIVTLPIGGTATAFAVAPQAGGRIVLAGDAFSDRVLTVAVRLLPSGAIDHSFGAGGVEALPLWQGVNAATAEPSGDLVMASVGDTVTRLTPEGLPDPSFGRNGTVTLSSNPKAAANGVTVAPGDKLILSGATTVGGRIVLTVMRLGG